MWKVLLLFLIVNSCESASLRSAKVRVQAATPRIIGGTPVESNALPFQAALIFNDAWFCGGVLISSDVVLTAAHCVEDAVSVVVTLGAHNLTNNEEPGRISLSAALVIHEQFNYSNTRNDIGLLKLAEPVTFNQYISPVSLPSIEDADEEYAGEIAAISGWGRYEDASGSLSQILQSVDVRVSRLEDCANFFNSETEEFVATSNICTSGYRNRGACNGDSGGPLVIDGVLVGLVSWGTNFCENCGYSVFARVGAFLEWIDANSVTS